MVCPPTCELTMRLHYSRYYENAFWDGSSIGHPPPNRRRFSGAGLEGMVVDLLAGARALELAPPGKIDFQV